VTQIVRFSRTKGHLEWLAVLLLLTAVTISGTVATFGGASLASAATNPPPPDSVVPFGTTAVGANAVSRPNAPIVGMAPTPNGRGYWMVGSDGGIFSFGDANFYGSEGRTHLNKPVVGMAATPDGGGYWLVAADGGVFSFGNAKYWGSTGHIVLNRPVVGMAATPNGGGYWLVAADGGVFSFGNARFWGSTGHIVLNKPVVGMAATPDGGGYWLVAADGGVFSFGNAKYWGSTGHIVLNKPVVGMAATQDDGGYWLVAADGGIFSFGDAAFYGSAAASRPASPAVGMAAVPGGVGYWVAFGAQPLAGKIVGIDPGHNGLNWTDTQYIDQPIWNGREYEACDTTGTETDGGYTEAQYNFNVATYLRQDLEAEGAQVVMTRTNNSGVGPCVTTRAAIINDAHADVAVDIHADGGPPGGRGFAVLEPVADGPNNDVISTSEQFASIMRDDFLGTGMPVSSYDGIDGLEPRNNLAGLNLTTVPKVLIECGNMRNATDAAILVTASFQQAAAAAMGQAITTFLTG
jgi:N-acetylmuramoyl-L-alanine amidase